jgi:hypothetical protein
MIFISFAPPKEMKQRKGVRKRQPHPFSPPATQALKAPPKRLRFAPFPACLRASKDSGMSYPDHNTINRFRRERLKG